MTRVQRLAALLTPVLAVSYFALAHAAAITHQPDVAVVAVATLTLATLMPGLLSRKLAAWLALALIVPALVWLYRQDLTMLPLYAPPVLINVFMAWGFGRTLLARRTPLIYRFVQLMHPPDDALDPAIAPYARRLTLLWTLLFLCMAAVNLVLALCATPDGLLLSAGVEPPFTVSQGVWSAFANFINYALVGLFFVVEFAYRRVRFPDQPYRSFFDFMRRLIAIGPRARQALRDDAGSH